MKDLKKGLEEFAKLLNKAKEKGELEGYVLIGGLAVSARARPRGTKDIDFLVKADKSFFTKTVPGLAAKKGYTCKLYKGDILDPVNGLVRIFDEDKNEFIDIIPVFWRWHEDVVNNAEEIDISKGISIPIARIEDLIVLKLKAGGPQDMLDVNELIEVSKKTKIDVERLKELAKKARVDKKLSRLMK